MDREVDPKFELSSVVKAAEKENKAVEFHRVRGSAFGVVANLTISRKMLALALDATEDRTVQEYVSRADHPVPPKIVKSGPCKENILLGDMSS